MAPMELGAGGSRRRNGRRISVVARSSLKLSIMVLERHKERLFSTIESA